MYLLLTPGPTPVPEEILRRCAAPPLHHRTPEFGRILNSVFDRLRYVFHTREGEIFVLAGTGTAAMEAAIVNFFSAGDRVIICSIGAFGTRWAAMARAYSLEVEVLEEEPGQAVNVERLSRRLKEGRPPAGVFAAHVETSTATVNPIASIGQLLAGSEILFLADTVSGLGGEEFKQDAWGVDVAVSASQKGLMCPPGLAFLSASPRAMRRCMESSLPRFYLDLRKYREAKKVPETPFTPPVTLLPGLDEALRMIQEETLERRWAGCRDLANHVRGLLKEKLGCPLFSKSPANVLTACPAPESVVRKGISMSAVLKRIRDENKISIADGQGDWKGKIFRIAHMGAITKDDVDRGIDALAGICRSL